MAALTLEAFLLSAVCLSRVYNHLPNANEPKPMLEIEILMAGRDKEQEDADVMFPDNF